MLLLRRAKEKDARLLGRLNQELIAAEGSDNLMNELQLANRMKAMLAGGWQAAIAEDESGPVGYCLFSKQEYGMGGKLEIYIRHFYIVAAKRGRGIGTMFFERLCQEYFPAEANLAVDALASNEQAGFFWRKVGFAPFSVQYRTGLK